MEIIQGILKTFWEYGHQGFCVQGALAKEEGRLYQTQFTARGVTGSIGSPRRSYK